MNKNLADLLPGETFVADFTNGTPYTTYRVSTPQGGMVTVEWYIPNTDGRPTVGRSTKPALTVATVS